MLFLSSIPHCHYYLTSLSSLTCSVFLTLSYSTLFSFLPHLTHLSFLSHISSFSPKLTRLSLLSHTHHFHLSQSCNQLSSRRWQIRLNRSGESSSALPQTWRGTQRAAIGIDTYMPCTDWSDPIFLNFVFLSLNVGFSYIY